MERQNQGLSAGFSESVNGCVVSMEILVVCSIDEQGHREVLAVESMVEESREFYMVLFQTLQERGLATPTLMISDAHAGLAATIREGFPGAPRQRSQVHFMRNILKHISQREKSFAAELRESMRFCNWMPEEYLRPICWND